MAAPPVFADLGKAAKDVFNKGYGFGMVKLDFRTRSANGVDFKACGASSMDSDRVSGSLESSYKWREFGLSFMEKWSTDNTLNTQITVEDQITPGLKLTVDTTFCPHSGKSRGKLQMGYRCECVCVCCGVDFDSGGPVAHSNAVLGFQGLLAGFQMSFNSATCRLSHSRVSIAYQTADFQLHTHLSDGSEFGGSIYQQVSSDLETAVSLSWTAGNSSSFGIAAKYMLDPNSSISAKVNNSSLLGIGYTQTLRPGVKLTLSALLDGRNCISTRGHHLGLGLELEA